MVARLFSHGKDLAVVLDPSILESMRIDANTPLEITTDGQKVTITPARATLSDEEFKDALEYVNDTHGKTLKRLAE